MNGGEPVEASPRTEEEIRSLPACPDVAMAAECRGITQVVHFTTVSGAIGILASNAIKSRARLPKDKYISHVYRPNSQTRKDELWLDYVNLSTERINDWMFQHSERWHAAEGNPWVVLSFHPCILAHPGVVFTTTNNIYPACMRAEGLAGFTRIFSNGIKGRYGTWHDRTNKLDAWPTDRQAEVLYPGELPCVHLQRIDVQVEESLDTIHGILSGLDREISVRHAPEAFE